MPGEINPTVPSTADEHCARAEKLLARAATADQSYDGFALAGVLAAEAQAHIAIAEYLIGREGPAGRH